MRRDPFIGWLCGLLACGGVDGGVSSSDTDSGSTSSTTSSGSGSSGASSSDASSGTGGTGPSPPRTCVAGADVSGSEIDPTVKKEVMGNDGMQMDHCDDDGNLVEALCEIETECGPGPNPGCMTTQTGNTTTMEFDCAGTCIDGTCEARCPAAEDELEYVQVGDPAVLQNNTDGRAYTCTLLFDQMNDTYDCTTDPVVGETTTVIGLGLAGSFCTGGDFGNIQTATGCSYACTIP